MDDDRNTNWSIIDSAWNKAYRKSDTPKYYQPSLFDDDVEWPVKIDVPLEQYYTETPSLQEYLRTNCDDILPDWWIEEHAHRLSDIGGEIELVVKCFRDGSLEVERAKIPKWRG